MNTQRFGLLTGLLAALATEGFAEDSAPRQRKLVVQVAADQPAVAVVAQGGGYGGNFAVRQEVDPQDKIERFLLLTPGAPLVIEAAITIDGQSFRIPREKLIDEMLTAADKDKDGKPTWDEALSNPRFSLNRFQLVNDAQRELLRKQYDRSNDKLVDRVEVRSLLAQMYQGGDFVVSPGFNYGMMVQVNGQIYNAGGAAADLTPLLDSNKDAVLSAEEIAGATARLKSRDANDDDLLYSQEVTGGVQANPRAAQNAAAANSRTAILLGPTATAETIYAALLQRYQFPKGELTAGSFPTLPEVFSELDADADGKLEMNEVLGLNQIEPQIQVAVNLGKRDGTRPIAVERHAEEIAAVSAPGATDDGSSLKFERPGFKLSIAANANPTPTYDYTQSANQLLKQYDKDSNGYLVKDELVANLQTYSQIWDEDGDGKIFAAEIAAAYQRMNAPQMSQVRATVTDQGNSVFAALDETGDGRLSLREMRNAAARLTIFDKDTDGRITPDEVPGSISVAFSQGAYGYAYSVQQRGVGGVGNATATDRGPDWFVKMDRNGDGDVTLKEFLGDEQQFAKLDANGDGFIERSEAAAAK